MMDALEMYYIYKETKSKNQINNQLTVKANAKFGPVIQEALCRRNSDS
jgi:hypothetical protein